MWPQTHCGCMLDFGCTCQDKKKNVYVWSLTEPQQEPWFCNVYFICLSYQYLIFIFCTATYFLPHSSALTFQFHLIFQQLTKKATESGIHNL